jgi:hypothetical protein
MPLLSSSPAKAETIRPSRVIAVAAGVPHEHRDRRHLRNEDIYVRDQIEKHLAYSMRSSDKAHDVSQVHTRLLCDRSAWRSGFFSRPETTLLKKRKSFHSRVKTCCS